MLDCNGGLEQAVAFGLARRHVGNRTAFRRQAKEACRKLALYAEHHGWRDSPALHFLDVAWQNKCVAIAHSWRRINQGLRRTLYVAIELGLSFDVQDFCTIAERYRPGYWIGDGENAYTLAVCMRNVSACKAFEHWKQRPPFIGDDVSGSEYQSKRSRLAKGLWFKYGGRELRVTSFAADGSHLVACDYKPREHDGWGRTIARRFTITPVDLRRDRHDRKWLAGG